MHLISSRFHALIIVASCLFLLHTHGYAETRQPEPIESSAISPDVFTDEIKVICIYAVRNGHLQPQVLTGNDLKTRSAIQVDGYIAGIVMFTTESMNISVDDRQMDVIRINRDGTYKLKYFGDFNHKEFLDTLGHSETGIHELPNLAQITGKYCYFPKIRGDAVCKQSFFNIKLSMGDVMITLPVNQTGCRKLCDINSDRGESQNILSFRDIGNSLSRLDQESPDFKRRITALSKGIETAESRFQAKLVDTINILNFNGPDNAYTYKGEKNIWIYKKTFQTVAPRELHSLAEHEACHILVDNTDLTSDSALRKHFADLKGFDAFSVERFMMVTQGAVPETKSTEPSSDSYFFAFINEKNFIEGMTGGHSQDNLEEFCASFLHSTLYINRLYTNLKRPITLPGGKKHLLTTGEQAQIFDIYIKTMDFILDATQKNQGPRYLSCYLQSMSRKLDKYPVLLLTGSVAGGRNVHVQSCAPATE